MATRFVFLNKMDRPGASLKSSILALLAHRLHPNPMILTLPIASFNPKHYEYGEPGIEGLVDLVKWNIWRWTKDGLVSCHPLPKSVEGFDSLGYMPSSHPIIPHIITARTHLLENLSIFSDDLMEILLDLPSDPSSYLALGSSEILPHLRRATLRNEVLPVLCGSAMQNIGTDLVMDYIGELLASPLDIPHDPQVQNAPLRLLAWKVNWDSKRGWMTFVRVYSGALWLQLAGWMIILISHSIGKLTRQSALVNTNRKKREHASKLLLLFASEVHEVDELPFGSVGVILGLKHTRTGDTLVAANGPVSNRSTLRHITPPTAVISASVIPQSHSDLVPVQDALESLTRTDPSVRIDIQEGQILVHGLGALHLEIINGRLRDEWKVNFEFGRRRVSYREGLGLEAPTAEWNTWTSDFGGKPISISIPLVVRSLVPGETGDPKWDGNIVIDHEKNEVSSESSAQPLLSDVAAGITSALSNSPHSSLAMTCIHIEIGNLHSLSTFAPSIIVGATASILRKCFQEAGAGPIMEPFSYLKVSVNESGLGKVVKDLTEQGGEILELSSGPTPGVDGTDDVGAYSDKGVYIPESWMTPSGLNVSSTSIQMVSRTKRVIHAVVPLSKFLDYSNRLRALSEGHGTFEMTNAGFRQVSDDRRLEILKEIGRA